MIDVRNKIFYMNFDEFMKRDIKMYKSIYKKVKAGYCGELKMWYLGVIK